MKIIEPVAINDGGFSNPSGGRTYFDRDGRLQVAGPNVPRITYDFENLDAAPYLMIEQAATKVLGGTNALSSWAAYTTGTATVSRTIVTDPLFGDVLRVTKTGGAPGERAGIIFGPLAGLAGDLYVASAYVRRGTSSTTGRAVHAEANRAAGGDLFAYASSAPMTTDSPRGWHRYSARNPALPPGTVLTGAGAAYAWVDSQVGDYIDVCLPDVDLGGLSSAMLTSAAPPFARAADVVSGAGTLAYSNLAEDSSTSVWRADIGYGVGNVCYRVETHRLYECLITNTGAVPEANTAGVTPKWMDIGATNKYAAFDNVASSPTVAPGGLIHYVFQAGRNANALAAISLDATDIRVAVTDRFGTVKYQRTIDLRSRQVGGWRDWFFKAFVRKRDVVFPDLPQYTGGLVTVAVSKGINQVSVGEMTIGHMETLGEVQWKPEVRIVDYSRKDTDAFGNTTFVKRRNAKIVSFDIFVENSQFDEVVRLLSLYTATPITWIGDETYGSLIVFGFAQDFRVVLDSPGGSFLSLQLQGLT